MKYALFFAALFSPFPLLAQELPIESHIDVCGDGSVEMNDEELSETLACTLEQRDSMGYLMERWQVYPKEIKQECLHRSRKENSVDYVELYACTQGR